MIATTDVDLRCSARGPNATRPRRNCSCCSPVRGPKTFTADANVSAAESEITAVQAELESAKADEVRFEERAANAGSTKQRDDAVTRRQLAEAKLRTAKDRLAAAKAALDRLKAGARPQEISAARARVQVVSAQIDALDHDRTETTITAPIAGIIGSRLVEPGEMVAVGTPLPQ
jgi:multidrug resistance efflux pump